MIKMIGIFKNIKDTNAFVNFFEKLGHEINQLPGVVGSEIIKISKMSSEVSQDLDGIEMMFETHYKNEEAIGKVLSSPEGIKIIQKIQDHGLAEHMYVYRGDVRGFNVDKLTDKLEDTSTAIRTMKVIELLNAVEHSAHNFLKGERKQGALQAVQLIRRELNLSE